MFPSLNGPSNGMRSCGVDVFQNTGHATRSLGPIRAKEIAVTVQRGANDDGDREEITGKSEETGKVSSKKLDGVNQVAACRSSRVRSSNP